MTITEPIRPKQRRRVFKPTTEEDLREIDAAMEFCKGSVLAAATLLGKEPGWLSSRIRYYRPLREKWAKPFGFHDNVLPFRVRTVDSYEQPNDLRVMRVDTIKSWIKRLKLDDKAAIRDWLDESIRHEVEIVSKWREDAAKYKKPVCRPNASEMPLAALSCDLTAGGCGNPTQQHPTLPAE